MNGAASPTSDRTPWAARSSGSQRLLRGMRLRCPRCGGGGLFASYFAIRERCPTCGWVFEREDGYWLGAMIVLITLVEGVFGALTVGWIVLTWPDPPWNTILVVGVVLNLLLPVVAYPWSKTTWMGLHTAFVRSALERDVPTRDGS